MKNAKSHLNLIPRLLSLALTLATALALGACGSDGNPMGPAPEPEPEPEAQPEPTLYEVQIALSHFTVMGTCEDGSENSGDFDYTIEIWHRDPNNVYRLYKEITGSFLGLPRDTHRVDQLVSFRVLAGKNYYVGMKATDTDPWPNTDDYVGYDQDVNTTGGELEHNHLLKIGGTGCGLTLAYTTKEIPIL